MNNIIVENIAITEGGGIFFSNSSPTMVGNTIIGNILTDDGLGGGICFFDCSEMVLLANNVIAENSANLDAGGIYCQNL